MASGERACPVRDGIAPAVPRFCCLLADKDSLSEPTRLAHSAWRRRVKRLSRWCACSPTKTRGSLPPRSTPLARLATRARRALASLGNTVGVYRSFDRNKNGVPAQQNSLLLIATALGYIKDPRGLAFLKALRVADGKLGSSPEIEIAVAKFGDAAFFEVPESIALPGNDWKAMAAYAQGLGQLGSLRAKSILLDLLAGKRYGKPDPRAVSDILTALAAAKVEGLRAILLDYLKAEDVIVRTTAATLLGELGDSGEPVIQALEAAYKAARTDKMNDARIAILEAALKLNHPMSVRVLSEEAREEDYVVRLKAAELLRESAAGPASTKPLQIGRVNTGHDRAFWLRMALLSETARNPIAVIHTRKGDIRIELYINDAPMTVDNFMQLARSGFYTD